MLVIMRMYTKRIALLTTFALCLIIMASLIASCSVQDHTTDDQHRSIILYGNNDPHDLEILRNRLDVFAGKGKYSLCEEDGHLTLRLPYSLSHNDKNLKVCLEALLTAPGVTNICCTSPYKSSNSTYTAVRVTPDILLSTSVENLELSDGIDADGEVPVLDMEPSPTRRINLHFQEAVAEQLHKLITNGSRLRLQDNRLYSDYDTRSFNTLYWTLSPDEKDSGNFFLEYDEADELYGHEELLLYILKHEELRKPFNYCIIDEISWEDPASSIYSGANQCTVEDIAEPCLLIQANASVSSITSNDKLAEAYRILLQRLDTLGTPYAVGYTDKKAIDIKISPQRLSRSILNLIFDIPYSKLYFEISGKNTVRINPEQLHIRYKEADSSIAVNLPADTVREIRESAGLYSEDLTDHELSLFLCSDDGPLARCSITQSFNQNSLLFKDCIIPLDSENGPWFASLLQHTVSKIDHSCPYLSVNYLCLYDGDQRVFNDTSLLPLPEKRLVSIDEVTSQVHKILPGAELKLSDSSFTLKVKMNLPLSEDGIDKAFSLIPDLLDICAQNNNLYEQIWFYPFEPVDDERSYLVFSTDRDSNLTLDGYMYNGLIDAYSEKIWKIIDNDPFFKDLSTAQKSDWNIRNF